MTNTCYCCIVCAAVFAIPVSALSKMDILKVTFSAGPRNRNNTSSMLMTCDVTHQKQCDRICAMTTVCKSFFFNPTTGVCQFHGAVFDLNWEGRQQDGLQYYFHEAQTTAMVPHQESTTSLSQSTAMALFKHNKDITLHKACAEGMLDEVKYILSQELEDINGRDNQGSTPVMTAAEKGQEAVFDFLLSRGCDLSVVNYLSNNILHVACSGGNTDIVMALVDDKKYDIESRGGNDWTPVMFAVVWGNIEVVELLVREGCTTTAVDPDKYNMLHLACDAGNENIAKFIITNKLVPIDSRGHIGRTPVILAALHGKTSVVRLLVRNGCDVRATDDNNNNILHAACMSGSVDTVQCIIKQHVVGLDSRGHRGRTPAMFAARYGGRDMLESLVSTGCNLGLVDDHKNNILHVACIRGHVSIVKYILALHTVDKESRGYLGKTAVLFAGEKGNIGAVNLLMKEGCEMKAVDDEENTILHLACHHGHVYMVRHLLKLDIVSGTETNKRGMTPIQVAKKKGHGKIVALLKAQKRS